MSNSFLKHFLSSSIATATSTAARYQSGVSSVSDQLPVESIAAVLSFRYSDGCAESVFPVETGLIGTGVQVLVGQFGGVVWHGTGTLGEPEFD